MRYPGSEKLEIIRIVEQSHLPATGDHGNVVKKGDEAAGHGEIS